MSSLLIDVLPFQRLQTVGAISYCDGHGVVTLIVGGIRGFGLALALKYR